MAATDGSAVRHGMMPFVYDTSISAYAIGALIITDNPYLGFDTHSIPDSTVSPPLINKQTPVPPGQLQQRLYLKMIWNKKITDGLQLLQSQDCG